MSNSKSKVEAAARFEDVAREFELAAKHSRIAAAHFREGDVPRGCAHAFASQGHASNADAFLNEAAKTHAAKARVEIE